MKFRSIEDFRILLEHVNLTELWPLSSWSMLALMIIHHPKEVLGPALLGLWGAAGSERLTACSGSFSVKVYGIPFKFQVIPLYIRLCITRLHFSNNYFLHFLVIDKSYTSLFHFLIVFCCFRIKHFYFLCKYLLMVVRLIPL